MMIVEINSNINKIINNARFLKYPTNYGSSFSGDHLLNISNALTRFTKSKSVSELEIISNELTSLNNYTKHDSSIPRLYAILESVRIVNLVTDNIGGCRVAIHKESLISKIIKLLDKLLKTKWVIYKIRLDISKEISIFKDTHGL